MKRQLLAAASLIMVGLAAGCGGGSTTASDSSTSAITGKVADGYLVGASVFLDKNGNYQLDTGEPSATTDANGAYTLTVDAADVGLYPIVALAIQGVTVDKDTNQAVANSYLLSLPKYSVSGTVSSNFISPMSSQLREMMETGNYQTIQQAMEDLRVKLGMPAGTNMAGDYISGGNQQMHSAAQNMATLMGWQMPQVFGTHSSATSVDVNRYRGMMGAIFSNISSIRGTNVQTSMTMNELRSTMTSQMVNMAPGQPFRNMSTSFRGGMMGGGASGGGMMGSGTGGSMMR
jgi:hypothetical protein